MYYCIYIIIWQSEKVHYVVADKTKTQVAGKKFVLRPVTDE